MPPLRAVLTGDIIGSTRVPEYARQEIPLQIRSAFEFVQQSHRFHSFMGVQVYRGDGWQILIGFPSEGLHVAVALRSWLRANTPVDSRVALAIDTVDPEQDRSVGESDGPAFRRSGRALDALGKRTMACLPPESTSDPTRTRLFEAVGVSVGALASRWSPAQARAVLLTLTLPPESGVYANQEQVAAEWEGGPITQQSVSEHLRKAGWDTLEELLTSYQAEAEAIEYQHVVSST